MSAQADKGKLDYYIIGSLNSCEDDIKYVADYYSSKGFEVEYVKKEPDAPFGYLVHKCFDNIKRSKHVIAVTNSSKLDIGEGTTYELEFARQIGVPYTIIRRQDYM